VEQTPACSEAAWKELMPVIRVQQVFGPAAYVS
jgi:hypothetical protein